MLEEFRRADCRIQAVDIGGLHAGADQGPARVAGRDSLLVMARGTGGELYERFNDLGVAMSQMLARTGVTYVLAVEPEKAAERRREYHPLRVELTHPSAAPGSSTGRATTRQRPTPARSRSRSCSPPPTR